VTIHARRLIICTIATSSDQHMPHPPPRLLHLVLPPLVAFQAISTDLYLPALPSIVADLDTDPARVQLTLSVFLAGFGIAQLLYGPLSDRYGRRPLLLFGTGLYVVASLACMLAGTIGSLILFRFLQAVGACCGSVLGRAVVRDVYPPVDAARILAYLAAAMTLAPATGPILGGWLTVSFGWRSTFAALAAFGLLLLVGIVLLLPETNQRKDPHATRPERLAANYLRLLRDPEYLGFVLVAAFGYSGIFAFISGSSYLLIDVIGLTPTAYGLCFAAVPLGYMAGSLLAARFGQRLGLRGMVGLGAGIGSLAGCVGLGLALLAPPSIVGIVGPQLVFMLGAGFLLPAAMASAVGPHPEMAGLASGLLGFGQLAIASLVGIAIGAGYNGTAVPMMLALALVALGSLLIFLTMLRGPLP
jgi:DHA1 family bicyclomycin/chloramphenicol resistance-like MFS transporter